MKFSEVSELSLVELKKKKKALKQDLFQAQMKNSLGQLSNPIEIRMMRRNLARLNTAITVKAVR